MPFANANGYPTAKDYIVINRGSLDKNMWTRYNRWFHKDVIEKSALANGQTISADQTARATRPIIEFNAGLKLFDFGTKNKQNVDLIDTFTKDIFSIIEGSTGYNIDGIDLVVHYPSIRISTLRLCTLCLSVPGGSTSPQ